MPSDRSLFNKESFINTLCSLLCIVFLSACSDSGNSNSVPPNPMPGGSGLSSCADTDSCFSNPVLEIGGDRLSQVQIPSDYTTTTRYPLIILLHGFGATGFLQSAYMGLDARVDRQQFILVFPNGTLNPRGERFWNATPTCCAPSGEAFQIDDVAYIRRLIEEAAATYSIDVDRIGLIGHSNGGAMALRMVCDASDLVTSAVSLAGWTFTDEASCGPVLNPVSVLTMHGDLDETIFYEGNEFDGGAYPSASETIRRFAVRAGCNEDNPELAPNLDVDGSIEGQETTVLRYAECVKGLDAELWTLVGSPHIPFPWVGTAIDSVVNWIIEHPRQ